MPKKPKSPIPIEQIDGMIRTIRGTRVMLDRDLAKIYGAPTEAFNQAVKRNRQRFPEDFMFRLTLEEAKALQASRSQFVTLKRGQNVKYLPYAFTDEVQKLAGKSRQNAHVLVGLSGEVSPRLREELEKRGMTVQDRLVPGPLK